ncbi:MAG: SWF/SNF helicase family protein, partial [Sandaracinaceae bacterium]|nr:SWF/SNF helicase family protein [Sandaracinaceae bacterium]
MTLNTAERDVYNAVKEFSRLVYSGGGWGQSMAEQTAYRYAASCIPAAIEYMLARLESHAGWDLNGEVDEDFLEEVAGPSPVPVSGVDRLRAALKYDADRDGDSKLEALVRALESIWSDDDEAKRPRRKIVLFSFFRRTLSYLSRRLSRLSITHERIDGGVPLPEREVRIAQFLGSTGCSLLLSSEVGGEGLDLQSASVIVNYDLPWNPMVVEQRIGRVDRIGQASDRIVILNLVCDGTVEDAILHRLYQRIH